MGYSQQIELHPWPIIPVQSDSSQRAEDDVESKQAGFLREVPNRTEEAMVSNNVLLIQVVLS
jgi:hypothetical protein